MSNCVSALKRLERKKLVHCEGLSGGAQDVQDEDFKLTKKGLKRYKALDSVLKEKADRIFDELAESTESRKPEKRKEERIESHDEIMFILYLLASQPDKHLDKAVLGSSYFKKFPQKGTTDFHIMWDRLENSGFIDQRHDQTGYGVTNDFFITSRGLDYYATYKESK
jgi:hypothetical protein